MQVDIDDVGVATLRAAEFLLGVSTSGGSMVYFAPLDKTGGPEQRWMVIDQDCWDSKSDNILVYVTEEMQILYRSMKDSSGKPVKADKDIGYRLLVRSGKLRMKIKDGCAGCRRFWGGDRPGIQCSKCHRCLACCREESVPNSCASSQAQEAKKGGYRRQ